MPALYALADVFVLPSIAGRDWQEQWGQSLIEAMAMGVPVVGSRSGSIAEVVGDSGLLVQAGDFLELAAALDTLLGDQPRRGKMAAEARSKGRARVRGRRAVAVSGLYRAMVAARGRR